MSAVYMPTGSQRLDDYVALEEARELVDDARMDPIDQDRILHARELVEHVRSDLPRHGTAYERADSAVDELREIARGHQPRANAEAAIHDIEELMRGLR